MLHSSLRMSAVELRYSRISLYRYDPTYFYFHGEDTSITLDRFSSSPSCIPKQYHHTIPSHTAIQCTPAQLITDVSSDGEGYALSGRGGIIWRVRCVVF